MYNVLFVLLTLRARIETKSFISDDQILQLQCSQRKINPYCFGNYNMLLPDKDKAAAPMSTPFSLSHNFFHNLNPFAHADAVLQKSDFLKVHVYYLSLSLFLFFFLKKKLKKNCSSFLSGMEYNVGFIVQLFKFNSSQCSLLSLFMYYVYQMMPT